MRIEDPELARLWRYIQRAGSDAPRGAEAIAAASGVPVEVVRALMDEGGGGSVEEIARAMDDRRRVEEARAALREAASKIASPADIGRALVDLEARLSALHRDAGAASTKDAALSLMEQLCAGEDRYLPIGFDSLEALGRWSYGSLPVIAARPGVGKTTLAIQIATNVAAAGIPVLFHSLEMPAEEIVAKMISPVARIPVTQIVEGRLGSSEAKAVADAAGVVAELPVTIRHSYSLADIVASSRSAARAGARLVVVDYLQLVDSGGASRYETVTQTSLALRRLALSCTAAGHPLVVLATSQLRRAQQGQEDKAPTIADLRESGQIEQDATHILLLHDRSKTGARDRVYVLGAKSRFAQRAVTSLRADLAYSQFVDDQAGAYPRE